MVKTNRLSVPLLLPEGGFLPLCFQTFTDVYNRLRPKDTDDTETFLHLRNCFFDNLTPQMNKSHSSVHLL